MKRFLILIAFLNFNQLSCASYNLARKLLRNSVQNLELASSGFMSQRAMRGQMEGRGKLVKIIYREPGKSMGFHNDHQWKKGEKHKLPSGVILNSFNPQERCNHPAFWATGVEESKVWLEYYRRRFSEADLRFGFISLIEDTGFPQMQIDHPEEWPITHLRKNTPFYRRALARVFHDNGKNSKVALNQAQMLDTEWFPVEYLDRYFSEEP